MNNLKYLRKNKKVSQLEIANYLGITSQAYGKYENNKRQPDNDTLIKLANYFGVSIDCILGRTAENNSTLESPFIQDFLQRFSRLPTVYQHVLAANLERLEKEIEKDEKDFQAVKKTRD